MELPIGGEGGELGSTTTQNVCILGSQLKCQRKMRIPRSKGDKKKDHRSGCYQNYRACQRGRKGWGKRGALSRNGIAREPSKKNRDKKRRQEKGGKTPCKSLKKGIKHAIILRRERDGENNGGSRGRTGVCSQGE